MKSAPRGVGLKYLLGDLQAPDHDARRRHGQQRPRERPGAEVWSVKGQITNQPTNRPTNPRVVFFIPLTHPAAMVESHIHAETRLPRAMKMAIWIDPPVGGEERGVRGCGGGWQVAQRGWWWVEAEGGGGRDLKGSMEKQCSKGNRMLTPPTLSPTLFPHCVSYPVR